jgi:hypothetical protein
MKKRGFSLTTLRPGTRILIESTIGTLYELTLVHPEWRLVEVYSTDPLFRSSPPKRGHFVESWSEKSGGVKVPDWIVKGGRMLFKFADASFLSEEVASIRLEGDGWHYELN